MSERVDIRADGFLRHAAAVAAEKTTIGAEVREGTLRDAILHSVGANSDHGLQSSNAEKKRAVMTLLNDPEWAKWSDNRIAKQCSVYHKTVASHRLSLGNFPSERTFRSKHGTTATMNTAGNRITQSRTI